MGGHAAGAAGPLSAGRWGDFRASVKRITLPTLVRCSLHHLSWSGGFSSARIPNGVMDFNVKKLASDAGVFFTRAMQVRKPGAPLLQDPSCSGKKQRERAPYCLTRYPGWWSRAVGRTRTHPTPTPTHTLALAHKRPSIIYCFTRATHLFRDEGC